MATSGSCSGYVFILQGILVIVNCAFTIGEYIASAFKNELYFFVSKRKIRTVCNDKIWYGSYDTYLISFE